MPEGIHPSGHESTAEVNVSFSLTIAFFSVARGLFTRTFNSLADVAPVFSRNLAFFLSPAALRLLNRCRSPLVFFLTLAFFSFACGFSSRVQPSLPRATSSRDLSALALGFVCRARLCHLLISPTLYAALSMCLTLSSLLVHLQTQYIGK